MDRIGIYIDGGYMDAILKRMKIKLNYSELADDICKKVKGRLLRVYYYDCLPFKDDKNPTQEEKVRYAQKQSYLTSIDRTPFFEVKRGRLDRHTFQCFHCNRKDYRYIQKLVDNLITVDVVSHSWRGLVDKIVLITGDADFIPAIQEAKDAGIITILFYSSVEGAYIHDQLKNLVDDRFAMDEAYLEQFKL